MSNVTWVSHGNHPKVGYGVAEPGQSLEAERLVAAATLTTLLRVDDLPPLDDVVLEAFSLVKGMFNRVHRQDQRDWFVTKVRLGFPSDERCRAVGNVMAACRRAVIQGHVEAWMVARERARGLKVRRSLAAYRGLRILDEAPGAGFAYVMSSPEDKDLIAVGVTRYPILKEVALVNAGRPDDPLGVRDAWWVSDVDAARAVLDRLTDGCYREGDGRYDVDSRDFRRDLDHALSARGLAMDPFASLTRVTKVGIGKVPLCEPGLRLSAVATMAARPGPMAYA